MGPHEIVVNFEGSLDVPLLELQLRQLLRVEHPGGVDGTLGTSMKAPHASRGSETRAIGWASENPRRRGPIVNAHSRWWALVAAGSLVIGLFSTGCVPDLGAWRVLPPGVDGGPPPGTDGGPPGGGPCGQPTLLATVETFGEGAAGYVLRFSLDANDAMRCANLSAAGALDGQPFAVVADERRFVVASREGVSGVDPETDRVVWMDAARGHPNDAFLLRVEDEELYAVAWGRLGSCSSIRCQINGLTLWDAAGTVRHEWSVGGPSLPTTGATAMTRSPVDPSRVLTLNPPNWSGAEMDPFAGVVYRDPPYVQLTGFLRTIYALDTDTPRVAWAGTIDGLEEVFYLNGESGGTNHSPSHVARCDCEMEHLVPDPTRPWGMLGLCNREGGVREIVRFRSTGPDCESLIRDDALGDARISSLAIRL